MIEALASNALQLYTDGAGTFGSWVPAISVLEAPYIWRDAAHMAKDKDLDALRERDDFKKLLAEVEAANVADKAPAKP